MFNSAIFVRVPVQFGIEPSLKRQLFSQVKVKNTLTFQFFKGLLEKENSGRWISLKLDGENGTEKK